ncbi:MAG: hypothetical protein OXE97_06475 [Gammaproteobacteria bacterium]|nr:hypothetical protein [Gammaproteobacteria bacterium]MCY4281510.1 hypothetical protein [Gammaproteobacteria bacterium]
MKTIQIMMDDDLLASLDQTQEVKRHGRSAVLRRATSEYLSHQRQAEITRQYQQGYGKDACLGDDFKGWEDEAAWIRE